MATQLLNTLLFIILAVLPMLSVANDYAIGAGDVIVIEVYNERDLSVRAKVYQSGVLRIPLLGDVTVAGKTSKQLSIDLELAYLDGYLVDPSVSVVIESYRPFFIRGAVSQSGIYGFEYNLTVDQAIAIAGGLKDRASKREWYIIRGNEKDRVKVTKESSVFPGDIIEIEESLF
jgi:polysaccharide export outer membrane protein